MAYLKKLWAMCWILAMVFATLPSPTDSQESADDSSLRGARERDRRTFHPYDPLDIRAYEEMLPFGEGGDRLNTKAGGDNWNIDLVGRWAFGTCLAVAAKGTYWLIRNGPCKFKFTTGTTLDEDDVLSVGASGRVVKTTVGTDDTVYRVGRCIAAVDTAIANDVLFRALADFRW